LIVSLRTFPLFLLLRLTDHFQVPVGSVLSSANDKPQTQVAVIALPTAKDRVSGTAY
jgi:hypothetical protein